MDEDPTEHVQEHIQHTAVHGGHDEHGQEAGAHAAHAHSHASAWITGAALTAAFLAAFAAVSGALSTSHLAQSMLIRIKANDDWSYYQAKSIKSSVLDLKTYSATLSHTPVRPKDLAKIEEYHTQMPEIQTEARTLEGVSAKHLEAHETYEGAGTLFHIAIAIVAIAVVAKRKEFWYVSIVAGAVGVVLFGKAYALAPPSMKEDEPPAAKAPEHPERKAKEHVKEHVAAPAKETAKDEGGEHSTK